MVKNCVNFHIERMTHGMDGWNHLDEEFAKSLDSIVSPADAEVVATTLMPGKR